MRPKKLLRALNRQTKTGCMQFQNRPAAIFFHPDYTVGTGITPVQLALADFTAGRELRPALKIHIDYGIYDTCFHIACQAFCNLLYYIIIILY